MAYFDVAGLLEAAAAGRPYVPPTQPQNIYQGLFKGLGDAATTAINYANKKKADEQQAQAMKATRDLAERDRAVANTKWSLEYARNMTNDEYNRNKPTTTPKLQRVTYDVIGDDGNTYTNVGVFNPDTGQTTYNEKYIRNKPTTAQKQNILIAKNNLNKIRQLYENSGNKRTNWVGAVDGRLPTFDRDQNEFRQLLGQMLAKTIHDLSGAAASDNERAFIRQFTPNVYMNSGAFEAGLDKMQRYLELEQKSPEELEAYATSQLRERATAQQSADLLDY